MTDENNNNNDDEFKYYELHFKTASEFLKNEHTRWHTWSLLYLGVVGSIFYSLDKIRDFIISDEIVLFIAFFFATIASFLWLVTLLNIASSTEGWHFILRHMEVSKSTENPFKTQYQRVQNFNRREYFWSSDHFIRHNAENVSDSDKYDIYKFNKYIPGKCYWKFLHSVTRTLLVCSALMILIFSSLFLWQFVKIIIMIVKSFELPFPFQACTDEAIYLVCLFIVILIFLGSGYFACRNDKKTTKNSLEKDIKNNDPLLDSFRDEDCKEL